MEIRNRNTVKIITYLDSSVSRMSGTGIIINDPENENYIYVFTARHCIYEYNKQISKREDISKVSCVYKFEDSQEFSDEIDVIDWIDDDKTDVAILKLVRKDILSVIPGGYVEDLIITDQFAEGDKIECIGYPGINDSRIEEIIGTCRRIEKFKDQFNIESSTPLTDYTGSSSQEVMQGFSGSGVFIKGSNKLIGVVIENPKSVGAKILTAVKINTFYDLLSGVGKDDWELISFRWLLQNELNRLSVDHFTKFDDAELTEINEILFKPISEQKVVLLLGPNINEQSDTEITSTKVLSNYCTRNNIPDAEEFDDLVDFTDNIFLDKNYSRDNFDDFLGEYFDTYGENDLVKDIAKINWREVLSFTPDTIFESIHEKNNGIQSLKIIYAKEEYYKRISSTQIKFVKLSGSINNRDFPPVVSTEDFKGQNAFYKEVLNHFKSTSTNIIWLAVGFSLNEPLSRRIIDRVAENLKSQGKKLFVVDSEINARRLPLLKEKNICIVKTGKKSFFDKYQEYYSVNKEVILRRRKIEFRNKNHKTVPISSESKYSLGNTIKQLNRYTSDTFIDAVDFYKGEEPSYSVIRGNFDVLRTGIQNRARKNIIDSFINSSERLNDVPLLLITGDYGVGKSTVCLRLINDIISCEDVDILAFEVLDTDKVDIEILLKLFQKSDCNNFLLFVNYIEQDSAFKSLFSFKNKLSTFDHSDINITLLSSIRVNMLKKYIRDKRFKGSYKEININRPLNENEIDDLLTKLKDNNLLEIRDARTKERLKNEIKTRYNGDILTSLMYLIKESRHKNLIEKAYNELSPEIQLAFKYTSLLYRFKILMPASVLKDLVTKNWDSFIEKVIKEDGYNILIQENPVYNSGSEPDILFRTRHSDISEELISSLVKNKDKQFVLYKELIGKLTEGYEMARLLVDTLKAIERNELFVKQKINELYRIGSNTFKNNSHFNIFYANILMRQKDIDSLKLAESNLENIYHIENKNGIKNHRIIHKRAEVSFALAKYYYKIENDTEMESYLESAEELFDQKRILDPLSAFSYKSYLRMKIWEIETFEYENEEEELGILNRIEDLFDDAEKYIIDQEWIIEERDKLNSLYESQYTERFFDNRLDETDDTPNYLLLKYFYYYRIGNIDKADGIIYLLEDHKELNYVAKVLFKHYGRNLYVNYNREKLSDLVKYNSSIHITNPLRYKYYNFISAAYDYRWGKYYDTIHKIRSSYENLNPEIVEKWKDSEGNPKIFNGIIRSTDNKKFVRVLDFGKNFPLVKGNYSNVRVGDEYTIELSFYLTGIRVNLVDRKELDKETSI